MNASITDIATKGWGAFGKEGGSLAVAEILSSSITVGAIAYADKLAPHLLQSTTDVIAKVVVEPNLELLEKIVSGLCRLDVCKIDKSQSREERAKHIARAIVLGGAAIVPAMLVKLATRRGLNQLTGLGDENPWWHLHKMSSHDKSIFWYDEGTHYGSMFVMNTLIPQPTNVMVEHTSSLMQKLFGWSKQQADESALMTVAHEVPNMLGLMAGLGAIANTRLRK